MKKYMIIFATDETIENKINEFVDKRPQYDLRNIKVVSSSNYLIIFEKQNQ